MQMFDFHDIRGCSKEEQIRAWSVEQAIDLNREGLNNGWACTNDSLVDMAAAIEKFVRDGGDNDPIIEEELSYDESTLSKVYDALKESGISVDVGVDIVNSMQNKGILFRERENG